MTPDPTLRELAQAAEFLAKRYGTMATGQDVQDLCFLLQEMRLKERQYVVDFLRSDENFGDQSAWLLGVQIEDGKHLP